MRPLTLPTNNISCVRRETGPSCVPIHKGKQGIPYPMSSSSVTAFSDDPLLLPSKSHSEHSSSIRSFDEALLVGLRSLPRISGHGVPTLAWLTDAFGLLGLTLAGSRPLISDPSPAAADALHALLEAGVPFLHSCNAVYREVRKLESGLLHLRLVCRLLSLKEDDDEDFAPDRQLTKEQLRRARKAIKDWESKSGRCVAAGEMIGVMAPEEPTGANVPAVRRATYAVEATSHLVMAAAMAVLGSGESNSSSEMAVSRRWLWAEAYNDVATEVSGRARAPRPGELEAVEASVSRLKAVMCGSEEGDGAARLRMAVEAVETGLKELTASLDGLRESVNGAYHEAIATRDAALNRMRSRMRQRCKT